jgi:hypothetical protein
MLAIDLKVQIIIGQFPICNFYLIERAVDNLNELQQSAYICGHSTESALL